MNTRNPEVVKMLGTPSQQRLACVRTFDASEARNLMNRLQIRASTNDRGEGSVQEGTAIQNLQNALLDYAMVQERVECSQTKEIAAAEAEYAELAGLEEDSSGGSGEGSSVSNQGRANDVSGEDSNGPDSTNDVDFMVDDLSDFKIEWEDSGEKFVGVVKESGPEILRVEKESTGKMNQVSRSSVTAILEGE